MKQLKQLKKIGIICLSFFLILFYSVPFSGHKAIAASLSLSPSSIASGYSTPIKVTASYASAVFTQGSTSVFLLDSNNQDTGKINNTNLTFGGTVSGTNYSTVSFYVGTGLAIGNYTVRIRVGTNTYDATFAVTDGSAVYAPTPTVSLNKAYALQGYTSTLSVVATGSNTNFVSGSTSASLINSSNQSVGSLGVAVQDSTHATVTIGTGLAAGNYTLKLATGSEIVTTPFQVKKAQVSLSSNNVAANYTTTQNVTATSSTAEFTIGQNTVVTLLDANGTVTGKIVQGSTQISNNSVSFSIATGLSEGSYTVQVKTPDGIATATYTVGQGGSTPTNNGGSGTGGTGGTTPGQAKDAYKDIKDHWAENDINYFASLNLINGYPDGSFRPNQEISRAEAASILVSQLKLPSVDAQFPDVSKTYWANKVIGAAAKAGFFSGYPSGKFLPENSLTRAEAASILVRAYNLTGKSTTKFSDVKGNWASSDIGVLLANNITVGYPDNTFKPNKGVTRAEFVSMLVRVLK
jgi:hypothetical protein